MNVIIIGSSGQLGSKLATAFSASHNVIALNRNNVGKPNKIRTEANKIILIVTELTPRSALATAKVIGLKSKL